MDVVIRTDASREIGTGHVMRCLTLSDRLKSSGATVRFICRPFEGNLIAFLRKRGHFVNILPALNSPIGCDPARHPTSHGAWLGTSFQTDASDTLRALGQDVPDWLIVDHYAIDRRWESLMRPHCQKILAIDDLADRPHDCDVLVDQTFGRTAEDYRALVPNDCRVAAGATYALLRDEFAKIRDESLYRRRNDTEVKNILITMGGIDNGNATGLILDALKSCRLSPQIKLFIVMGGQSPWLTHVQEKAKNFPWLAEVIVDTSDMARLMSESDLAIGAAGSTSWERCCLGLPCVIVVLAENQEMTAHRLDAAGAAKAIDDIHDVPGSLYRALHPLMEHVEKRRRMIDACAAITDGHGTSRVLDLLEF